MPSCPKNKSGAKPKMQMTAPTWIKSAMLYAVAGLFMLTHSAIAADSVAADELLKSKLAQVFKILQKADLEQQAKSNEIVEIVSPMFDFQLMARLSLGREQWTKLGKENRERFTDLFISRLRGSYLSRITAYTDETVTYESPVKVDGKVHIPTYLISKGNKIGMLYKFYQANDQWKIYDLEIQGVSIIRSYQAQFKEILQKGTFDDLLLKMENPAND
jgi:phospholipid transport system substrate-binding protein